MSHESSEREHDRAEEDVGADLQGAEYDAVAATGGKKWKRMIQSATCLVKWM